MPKYINSSKQVIDTAGLMFPKDKGAKKKRMTPKSRPSILQQKDGRCYLCIKEGNWQKHSIIHEHHVFFGEKYHATSEALGFKVYLCLEHHTKGEAAVHLNSESARLIQKDCQRAFEREHSREEWMQVMERNFLTEE